MECFLVKARLVISSVAAQHATYRHCVVQNPADGREAAVVLLLGLDPSDAAGQVLLVDEDKLFGVAERLDNEGGQPHGAGAAATESRVRLVGVLVGELALVACSSERHRLEDMLNPGASPTGGGRGARPPHF